MTTNIEELIDILIQAINEENYREKYIREFQNIIWNIDKDDMNPEILSMFDELAYDLDYYEPDPIKRKEELSLYGDDEAVNRVKIFLIKYNFSDDL